MIINCIDGKYREELLSKKVVDLISSGVKTDKILILCLNSFKKERILKEINNALSYKNINGYSQINISSFSAIVYNSLMKNWVKIENILNNKNGDPEIIPTLSGLDSTQYFFRKIIKTEEFNDYFSKKNLMHQLLRRYKLIVENALTDEEINQKTQLLDETFAQNALKTINKYKIDSSKNRIFDNLKQISSFLYLLKNNLINDFDNIEYFIIDSADELNYVAFEFCKFLIKKVKEVTIFIDKNGCSRKGYLCAYENVYYDLKKEFNFDELEIKTKNKIEKTANKLAYNIRENREFELENFEIHTFSKRLEMIEDASKKILALISKGIPINKIAIITPLIDTSLIFMFNEIFQNKAIKLQLLTGNKKITEDIYVFATITILELLNTNWNIKPTAFDIRILTNCVLNIPLFTCEKIIKYYEKKYTLPDNTDESILEYKNLIKIINDTELKGKKLSTQFEEIFSTIIAPTMPINADFDTINLFNKSIIEFEKIQKNFKKYDNIELTAKDWLLHIKSSVVSQTPSKPEHIDPNALIISTAQKIVDFSLETDYQFWLDVSSSEWLKEDTGTIYNSWVFQKNFVYEKFTPELNKTFTLDKTSRLIRKLTLCAKEKIFAYSSIYDDTGKENNGELIEKLNLKEEKKEFHFIPRDDQLNIFNYEKGKLAVPAVPGAGKTTVMLALLLNLVSKGITPTSILVLTYMESAAKNFLNKYKKATGQTTKLPQISTIHSFAFKILMENNNYALINLPEDFSICDDILKTAIIKEITTYNLPLGENIDDWSALMLSGISKAKTNNLDLLTLKKVANKDNQINEFYQIYQAYQEKLKELSLLDYDDLLIYALKLLKENKEVANFYQNKFQYIIEDEAQDSTPIQQELISIISQKHKNIIRCGDVNQAILGTFSNADLDGFKKFINENKKEEMYRSQRCNKKIFQLANKLIDIVEMNSDTQNTFYNIKMQEVPNKNPINENPLNYRILENPIDEKEFILNEIKNKIKNCNDLPSIAILLRNNRQVAFWNAFIEKQGLKTICRGDSYRQKKIFRFILSAIELFYSPWNNKIVAQFYKHLCEIKEIQINNDLFEFIANNENKVLTPNFLSQNRIINQDFETFWWEAFSIIENNIIDIQEIVVLCANRYFNDIIDKSNAYLFATLIKRYVTTISNEEKFKFNYLPELIKYFKNLFTQKSIKGMNYFNKEDEDNELKGYIQIMTVHKSKGAEFDYVYMPEFTDYNYSLNLEKVTNKIKKRKRPLLSKLDKIIFKKELFIDNIAKEEISETLRLIYVGITRAKKGLTFSYSIKNEYKKQNEEVKILKEILNIN